MRERTSVSLEAEVRRKAEAAARRLGVSVSSLVNEALAAFLRRRAPRQDDPAFRRHPFQGASGTGGIADTVYDRP